jgi:hypothetical protein
MFSRPHTFDKMEETRSHSHSQEFEKSDDNALEMASTHTPQTEQDKQKLSPTGSNGSSGPVVHEKVSQR